MPVERAILCGNILLALLTAGVTAGGAAVFMHTGNSTAFWAYLTVSVLLLAAACILLAKNTRKDVYKRQSL